MKKLLLYILTLSMLITSSVFVNPVATALVQTTTANEQALINAGYVAISTEYDLRHKMSDGASKTAPNKYYLTNDIVLEQGAFDFPQDIILNGNGYALLPPSISDEAHPLLPAKYQDTTAENQEYRLLKHDNYGWGSRPSNTTAEDIKADNTDGLIGHHVYETVCFFTFKRANGRYYNVTFENLSFGTSQRPFCMKDDHINNSWSGLALFSTSMYVENLTCNNVDFHVRLSKPLEGSGNMAGFLSVAYNTTTMTNCNMDATIRSPLTTSQAGCFFAQTQNSTDMQLTMTNCTVLPGSVLEKEAQSGGFVGQTSGTAYFENCVNYCNLVQTGGQHAGGIIANLYNGGIKVTFKKCVNYGTIQGRQSMGGICGAIIGNAATKTASNPIVANFEYCINAGDVRPTPATVTKDANGNVTSTTYYGESCGGLLGTYHSFVKVTMDNCVNLGMIHGPEKTTTKDGYFHASAGNFIGSIGQLYYFTGTDNYERQCATLKMVDGKRTCSHSSTDHSWLWYSNDSQWSWHYTYDALPAKITNSMLLGKIVFGENCAKMNTTTGLDQAGTQMEMGDIKLYGLVGNSVRVDATNSKGNIKPDHTPGDSDSITTEINTRELLQDHLTPWLINNGFVERCQIDYPTLRPSDETTDYANELFTVATGPYVIGTPKITAVLTGANHNHVRVVASINSREYTKVGFNYSVYTYDENGNQTSSMGDFDIWSNSIYEDVDFRTADELGGRYVYEMTLLNLLDNQTVCVSIVPKIVAQREDYCYRENSQGTLGTHGGEYIGQRYNLYFYGGELVKCEVLDPFITNTRVPPIVTGKIVHTNNQAKS